MKYFFGWDVSTAVIGVCAVSNTGPVLWNTIDLRRFDDMIEKYRHARNSICAILNDRLFVGCEVDHTIEDRLGGFTRGMTNQNTLLKLSAMNAVVTSFIDTYGSNQSIRHLLPRTVMKHVGLKAQKGEDKKKIAVEFARKETVDCVNPFVPEYTKGGNFKPGVTDLADAYLLARAGLNICSKSVK